MRRAVEAMAAQVARVYAPPLGAITQRLETLTMATKATGERPVMALTPQTYATQLRRATDDAARPLSAEM